MIHGFSILQITNVGQLGRLSPRYSTWLAFGRYL